MDPTNSPEITSISRLHAKTRLGQAFTLDQMASEYRALRASVLEHWMAQDGGLSGEVREIVRFGECIDQSWFEGMSWFSGQIEHARELFTAVLSHDMRTPLGAVVLSAEILLRDENLGPIPAKLAVRILNSGNRMTQMIEDLLDFTRVRLGTRLPTSPSECNLGPVLRLAVEELSALHPTSVLEYDCEGDLRGQWDGGRIAQMLSNLVGNAIQHGEADRPVRILARGEPDQVILTVHNEGPPIAPEMINKIFDPLMRGVVQEAERRSRQESLGLGLYISQHIAKAHGGDIDVVSSLEQGTTFTVCLSKKYEAVAGARTAGKASA